MRGRRAHLWRVGGDERGGDTMFCYLSEVTGHTGRGTAGARVSPVQHVPGTAWRDFLPRWRVESKELIPLLLGREAPWLEAFSLAPPVSTGINTHQITVDKKVFGTQ